VLIGEHRLCGCDQGLSVRVDLAALGHLHQ
jgi:hypothetical protein